MRKFLKFIKKREDKKINLLFKRNEDQITDDTMKCKIFTIFFSSFSTKEVNCDQKLKTINISN